MNFYSREDQCGIIGVKISVVWSVNKFKLGLQI